MGRGLRIESYGLPEVDERPLNGPTLPTEQPIENFGGGAAAAEAHAQIGGVLREVQQNSQEKYQEEYRNAVQLQGLELANQLTQEETRAKNALAQVKGKDALEARGKTLQDYDKFFQSLTKDVTNPHVKQLAQEHYAQRRNTLDAWATPYANGQMEEYDNGELTASMQTSRDSAIADPSPMNYAQSKKDQSFAIAEFGQRNSKGGKWIQQHQAEAISSTALEALHAIATSGNDLAAKQFYDVNKDDFRGRDIASANKLVESSSYRGEAQREVARIFAPQQEVTKTGDMSWRVDEASTSEAQTYAEVDKIKDPKLQDMVRDRVRERWGDIKRVRQDAEREDVTKAANLIEATPSVDAIPVDLYERLPMTTRRQIDARIKQIKEGNGPAPISDKYLSYVRESAISPDKFVRRNFAAMRDEITGKEAEELTKEQAKIISGDERSAKKRAGFLTVEEMGKSRLKALEVTDPDQVDMFMNALNRDYYTWRNDPKNEGKPMMPADASALVSGLLGRKKAWWQFWGNPNTPILRKIEDVPDADRKAIEKQLKANGEAATEGRIIDIYEKSK